MSTRSCNPFLRGNDLLTAARSPIDECRACGCFVTPDTGIPLDNGYCSHYSCHCGTKWAVNWTRSTG